RSGPLPGRVRCVGGSRRGVAAREAGGDAAARHPHAGGVRRAQAPAARRLSRAEPDGAGPRAGPALRTIRDRPDRPDRPGPSGPPATLTVEAPVGETRPVVAGHDVEEETTP